GCTVYRYTYTVWKIKDVLSSQFLGFFFSSRRRHTRFSRDWSSDVCSSDLSADASDAPCRPPGSRGTAAAPRRRYRHRYSPGKPRSASRLLRRRPTPCATPPLPGG